MTQPADITLANQSGASYRTEHNAINQGFGTNHKGGSEPSYVVTGMTWIDDTTTPWLWNIFDGAASFAFMEVNPSTNNVTLVNVKAGDARTEGANIAQIQDSTTKWAGTSGGTNTVTGTLSPVITAYADGQQFAFLAGGTNTGAATLNLNGVGAKAIEKRQAALVAGDIAAQDIVKVVYDSTNDAFQMISPTIGAVDGFETGDILPTFKQTAKTGYLLINGDTIGSATSGAAQASADNQALFEFLWDNSDDADMPVSTGRGASANADWVANETLTMPDARGRSGIGFGQGAGLSDNWTMGETGGEEDHAQTTAELKGHTHLLNGRTGSSQSGSSGVQGTNTDASPLDATSIDSTGSGTAFNVIHPVFGLNWQVKL